MNVQIQLAKQHQEDGWEINIFNIIVNGDVVVGNGAMVTSKEGPYLERIDIYDGYQNGGYGTQALHELTNIYGPYITAPDNADCQRLMERVGTESNDGYAVDQGFGVYRIG